MANCQSRARHALDLECPVCVRSRSRGFLNATAASRQYIICSSKYRREIFGFLRLNGTGKTTTIRILLDLLRPNSGRAFLLGQDCQAEAIQPRAQIGCLLGEMEIYSHSTRGEVFDFLPGLNHRHVAQKWTRERQDRLQLPDSDLIRKLREYSTCKKRKLGIIQAFQADPRLPILDELPRDSIP